MRLTMERSLVLAALSLAGLLLLVAADRASYERRCAMACAPFTTPQFVAAERRAMDWRRPLAAALPLLTFVTGWTIGRGVFGRRAHRA